MVYKTKGTCSSEIIFDVDENNVVTKLEFKGGCKGNLRGLCALAVGRKADDLVAALRGIECRGNTSCPDQLAQALEQYLAETQTK